MRTTLLTIMVGLPLLAAVIMILLTVTYRRFRRRVPELRTTDDLRQLKSLAKLQMYLSLIAHPVLTIGGVLAAWLVGWIIWREFGWLDLVLYGVLPICLACVVAFVGESPAELAQTIPASEQSLAQERDRIVETWMNRLLPDW